MGADAAADTGDKVQMSSCRSRDCLYRNLNGFDSSHEGL